MITRKIAVTMAAAIAMCGGLSAAAAGAGASPAGAAVAASASVNGDLSAVSASSATDAWAVGSTGTSPYLLTEHWNGKTWTRVPVPSLKGDNAYSILSSVADISPADVWAVGTLQNSTGSTAVALHWNGKKWSEVPVPALNRDESLSSVSGLSATSAWATGDYYAAAQDSVIFHWNGKSWSRISAPDGASSYLSAVKAQSADNAWAVGDVYSGYISSSLILHWNGASWKRVPSPSPVYGKYGNGLAGVTAISATSAWAVGCTDGCPVGGTPQIEQWNGVSWKQAAPPATPFGLYNLGAVAATSAGNIWAVGASGPVTSESASTVHGNGKTWTLSGIRNAGLGGVAATSVSNAWAVGATVTTTLPYTFHVLIMHWNGKTWTREQ